LHQRRPRRKEGASEIERRPSGALGGIDIDDGV
jgi:hypothetical protein